MPDNHENWEAEQHTVHAWQRPDGKWALDLPPDPETWPMTIARRPRGIDKILVSRPESTASTEDPALTAAGFKRGRTEQEWRIPLSSLPARTYPSATHRLVSVAECDLAHVAELDNEVRQAVPGCEGWSGTVADLRDTLDDEAFDPNLYLVAVQHASAPYSPYRYLEGDGFWVDIS